MKKILSYIIPIILLGLVSCQKHDIDLIFGEPNQRIEDTLNIRNKALLASPYGWKTIFSPKGGGTYLFYMQFQADNRVLMVSDLNSNTTVPDTSSYVLRATGQPSLIFDTYNYLHILSHPYNPISGGTGGQGRQSDYEFYFKSVSADSIVLIGVKNQNVMILKKATEEEADFYKNGGISKTISEATSALNRARLYVDENGSQVSVDLSFALKTFSLTRTDANNNEVISSSAFTFAADGLDLVSPLLYNNTPFSKVYWDSTNKQFYLMINGAKVPVIAVAPPPLHTLLDQPEYKYLAVDPPTMPQYGKFNDLLQADIQATTDAGRTYNHFYFNFQPGLSNGANVVFGVTTASSSYWIEYNYYKMEYVDEDVGIVRFTFIGNNGSIPATLRYSKTLRAYFESHTFKIDYSDEPSPTGKIMGGMTCVEEPDVSFYGRFEAVWSNW
ncbi:DUF4302 domain-containing protein [Pedobacter sp. BS3]|uniref:DUF4302 domain-containing protein n=1 Tax=Pedobacter sp. BS3 TaxID=2567937 RepID=UPI0011F03693|nr:DUF4302 domain-containing protein [Pedobacter sp. BS3]TZF82662.1 DUF4302 domain-containing protein [Pedobacter sp. BS3]